MYLARSGPGTRLKGDTNGRIKVISIQHRTQTVTKGQIIEAVNLSMLKKRRGFESYGVFGNQELPKPSRYKYSFIPYPFFIQCPQMACMPTPGALPPIALERTSHISSVILRRSIGPNAPTTTILVSVDPIGDSAPSATDPLPHGEDA